jgi:hypothetical protein
MKIFRNYILLFLLFGYEGMALSKVIHPKNTSSFRSNRYLIDPVLDKAHPAQVEGANHKMPDEYLASNQVLFTENKGQMRDVNHKPVPFVLFRAEAPGMNVYITDEGLTYVFVKPEKAVNDFPNERKGRRDISPFAEESNMSAQYAWINVHLKDAHISTEHINREGVSSAHFNFFNENCPGGVYNVHRYEKITIKDVYPGIDWVLYNSRKDGMKYDFLVHPGADPSRIKLIYEGDQSLRLNNDGGISMLTELGSLTESRPFSYTGNQSNEIQSSYKLTSLSEHRNLLEFNIADYPIGQTLVIDPELNWFTFFGGNNWDNCFSSDTDGSGNLYLTGYTQSVNFPVQDPGGSAFFSNTFGAGGIESDIFLVKFSSSGALLWATYYSGSDFENGYFVSADANANVYVAGITRSVNFPVQNSGSGAFFQQNSGGDFDAFILKFDQNGTRLWATYCGGSQYDAAFSLCIDPAGFLLVGGKTASQNFPTQNSGAFFQANMAGVADAFILRFDTNCSIQWATFYGGSDNDEAHSIQTDANGNIYLSGETTSNDFPVQGNGSFLQSANAGQIDVFIVKFSPAGNRQWASYYGGSSFDLLFSVAIDSQGTIQLTGSTESVDFPTQNAGTFYQGTFIGGLSDLFFIKFDSNGNRLWATFFGGNGNTVTGTSFDFYSSFDVLECDECDNIYFCAATDDASFPSNANNVNSPFFDNAANANTVAYEIILGRFSGSGELHWSSYLNGSGNEQGSCLAIDRNNRFIYVGGSTIPQFGVPYLASFFPLTNPSGGAFFDNSIDPNGLDGYEMLVAKFTIPAILVSSNITQATNCNSCDGAATVIVSQGEGPYTFEWSNGLFQSYLTNQSASISGLCPGDYSVIVRGGCGRPDTINFSIVSQAGSPSFSQINASSCNSYTAPWGVVYTQSGSYSDTLTAANGCDSIITLNLTIGTAYQSTQTITACNNYTAPWGAVITQSGSYSDTVSAVNGCDSIITVNLTIKGSTLSRQVITSCGPFNAADGTLYEQSVSFTDTLSDITGCDSVVTYDLTILPPASVTVSPSDLNLSLGDTVQLFATGGSSYQWSPADGLSCTTCLWQVRKQVWFIRSVPPTHRAAPTQTAFVSKWISNVINSSSPISLRPTPPALR